MAPEIRDIKPEELAAAVEMLRSGKAPIRFRSAAEILQAVQLGVIDKKEARRALGYRARRQPKQLRIANEQRAKGVN